MCAEIDHYSRDYREYPPDDPRLALATYTPELEAALTADLKALRDRWSAQQVGVMVSAVTRQADGARRAVTLMGGPNDDMLTTATSLAASVLLGAAKPGKWTAAVQVAYIEFVTTLAQILREACAAHDADGPHDD